MQDKSIENNNIDLSKQFTIPMIQQIHNINDEGFSAFSKDEQEELIKYLKVYLIYSKRNIIFL